MIYGTALGLGDSLVAAARADHDGGAGLGWLEQLPGLLDPVTGTEWAVLNRGVSGQTTREVLDRTPGAVRELATCAGAKWAVVLCSTNDSKGAGADHDAWEVLYRLLVHWPRRHGIPLALCTLPPLDPRGMPSFTRASQDWCIAASERIRAIAVELHNRPSPVYVVELADLPAEMLVDGVHLTAEGNAEVARRVAAVLAPEAAP